MKRPMILIGLVCVLSGCQGGGSVVDPFMGQSTVPPPPTVQFPQSQGGQPYYPGTPAPNSVPPASSTPPPAGYQYPPQSSIPEQNKTGSTPASAERVLLTERSTPIRIVEPRRGTSGRPVPVGSRDDQQAATGSGERQPVVTAAYESAVESSNRVSSDGAVELADLPRSTTSRSPATRGSRSSYAYAPDYSWLRGRVEYLASKRQWKLRYIPIDGATDDYGGSVVIRNPSMLSNVRAGDFVEVSGTVRADTAESAAISPDYEVSRIGS